MTNTSTTNISMAAIERAVMSYLNSKDGATIKDQDAFLPTPGINLDLIAPYSTAKNLAHGCVAYLPNGSINISLIADTTQESAVVEFDPSFRRLTWYVSFTDKARKAFGNKPSALNRGFDGFPEAKAYAIALAALAGVEIGLVELQQAEMANPDHISDSI